MNYTKIICFRTAGTGCSDAVTPISVSETCTTIEDGSRCETECVSTTESPSEPQPEYYTCSKYGTWEQGNVKFAYPACARTFVTVFTHIYCIHA